MVFVFFSFPQWSFWECVLGCVPGWLQSCGTPWAIYMLLPWPLFAIHCYKKWKMFPSVTGITDSCMTLLGHGDLDLVSCCLWLWTHLRHICRPSCNWGLNLSLFMSVTSSARSSSLKHPSVIGIVFLNTHDHSRLSSNASQAPLHQPRTPMRAYSSTHAVSLFRVVYFHK